MAAQSKELIKVTVLLPPDTIARLDHMTSRALLGSRGRTIQSIVDSLWESQYDVQAILNTLNTMQVQSQQQPQQMQRPEVLSAAFAMILYDEYH